MPAPPEHFDRLRSLARALARARHQTGAAQGSAPAPAAGGRARALLLVAAAAVAALFVPTAWIPCGLRDCRAPVATIPDTVAVVMARPTSTAADDVDDSRAVAVTPAPTPAAEPPAERAWAVPPTPTRRAAPTLSGRWTVTNAIETTNRRAFTGLRIRFRIELEQRGDRLTGRGVKVAVDEKRLPRRQQTRIVLAGTIRGEEAVVRFVEHGTRRASTGGFRWRISPDGRRLQGTFDSNAAASRGRSDATRDG